MLQVRRNLMFSFTSFLTEEAEGAKLKHITHAEDRPIQHGAPGFQHTYEALHHAHEHIKSGGHSSALTMKYDGSPSIVFGHHPETGKFFVASKSAFNVNPKINYTHQDIAKNHGHAPGLMEKLHGALNHLRKVSPKTGVYQGDLMFTHGDIQDKKSKGVSFTPNTITYTAKGDEADKVRRAKIGVVVHTQYHGKDIKSMKSDPHPDLHNFSEHPDVWTQSANHDTKQVHYSDAAQEQFRKYMAGARRIHETHGKTMYNATQLHRGEGGHMENYINHTVRTDETPSAEGLQNFLRDKYKKATSKLKTPAAIGRKKSEAKHLYDHVSHNREQYNHLFKMHHYLQQAKNVLVDTLNQHTGGLEHHIDSKSTNPEGYVIHHRGEPTKLVNRHEFSKANLLKVRK